MIEICIDLRPWIAIVTGLSCLIGGVLLIGAAFAVLRGDPWPRTEIHGRDVHSVPEDIQ